MLRRARSFIAGATVVALMLLSLSGLCCAVTCRWSMMPVAAAADSAMPSCHEMTPPAGTALATSTMCTAPRSAEIAAAMPLSPVLAAPIRVAIVVAPAEAVRPGNLSARPPSISSSCTTRAVLRV